MGLFVWLVKDILASWGEAFSWLGALQNPASFLVLPLPIHSQELLRLRYRSALFGVRPGNPSAMSRIGTELCGVTFPAATVGSRRGWDGAEKS